MAYEEIQVERDGAVGIITLDRPKVLNALGPQLLTELVDALEDFDRDPEVRCIALLGSDRAFAAGADIGTMADASPIQMLRDDTFSRIERIRTLTTPVVAGGSGFALGGRCELAASMTVLIRCLMSAATI